MSEILLHGVCPADSEVYRQAASWVRAHYSPREIMVTHIAGLLDKITHAEMWRDQALERAACSECEARHLEAGMRRLDLHNARLMARSAWLQKRLIEAGLPAVGEENA